MRTHLKVAALVAATLLLVLTGLITSSLASGAAPAPARVGAAPDCRPELIDGALNPGKSLSIDVALQPSDPAALATYAEAVSTPGNAEFHDYLTVSQFRSQFGPSQASIDAVDAALTADGLTPGSVSPNGLIIPVTATAAQLSSAFDTAFDTVTLPGGRSAFANTLAPQFSGTVANLIQSVVGLDDLAHQNPMALRVGHHERDVATRHIASASHHSSARENAHTTAPVACSDATAQSTYYQQNFPQVNGNAYTAPEIASTYGLDSLWNAGDFGAGQTVGLIEYEEFATSDLQTYDSCYGLGTGSNVSVTNIDGGPTADPDGYTGSAYGAGEAILDVQQIAGLAPAANVQVYEAPNDSPKATLDMYTAMVDNPAINIISTSWGECEALETLSAAKTEDTILEQAAVEGKSVFAAAGDDGANDCYPDGTTAQDTSTAVDFPGSSPWVTSVGGTSLINGSATDQTVWNDGSATYNNINPSTSGNGAGGGGVSDFFAMPSYQSAAPSTVGVVNSASSKTTCATDSGNTGGYCREVPDVSADADPFTGYIGVYEGQWESSGGTSAAAPMWAALTALANASSSCAAAPIGFANGVIYAVADNATDDPRDYTDITVGNNAYAPSGYTGASFAAGAGFDEASGLGTPNAATLVPDLCAAAATGQFKATTTTVAPTTTTSTPTTTAPTGYTGPPKLQFIVTKPKVGQTSLGVKMLCYGSTGHCAKVLTILFSLQTIRNGRVIALSAIRQAQPQRTRYEVVVFGSQRTQLAAGYEVTFRLGLRGIGRRFFARGRNVKCILDFSYDGRYHVRAIKFTARHLRTIG